ncbi:MAG: hypothetical protein ABI467_30715 [Kofleriaceae bacterium]
MATKLFAFVLALVVLGGCRDDVCARKSDCAHGLTCSAEGTCVAAPDGGLSESATDAATESATDAATDAAIIDGGM